MIGGVRSGTASRFSSARGKAAPLSSADLLGNLLERPQQPDGQCARVYGGQRRIVLHNVLDELHTLLVSRHVNSFHIHPLPSPGDARRENRRPVGPHDGRPVPVRCGISSPGVQADGRRPATCPQPSPRARSPLRPEVTGSEDLRHPGPPVLDSGASPSGVRESSAAERSRTSCHPLRLPNSRRVGSEPAQRYNRHWSPRSPQSPVTPPSAPR